MIDPDFPRTRWRVEPASGEASRVSGMGGGGHRGPRRDTLLHHTMMHVDRRQQPEAGVVVLGVALMRVISSSLLWDWVISRSLPGYRGA